MACQGLVVSTRYLSGRLKPWIGIRPNTVACSTSRFKLGNRDLTHIAWRLMSSSNKPRRKGCKGWSCSQGAFQSLSLHPSQQAIVGENHLESKWTKTSKEAGEQLCTCNHIKLIGAFLNVLLVLLSFVYTL